MENFHIPRAIEKEFESCVKVGKVLILLGARRVGKTQLIKKYLNNKSPEDYLLLNGEDQLTVDLLNERTIINYQRILRDKKLLVIDEAQKIPEVGLKLKLMVDNIDNLRVIATGSSVFDLENKLGEPLVGRSNTLFLYPLAQMELANLEDYITTKGKLEERLLFGGYPELIEYPNWKEKIKYLNEMVNSYLLKDILEYDGIRKSNKIVDLLRMLAMQIGKEVNIEELARSLKGISRNTIEHYLDLLSKVFIIYNVTGFNRNLRKEITKSSRWYFYDNGILNAILTNFNTLNIRPDIGALWENYLMSERIKLNTYSNRNWNYYFWRTYDQQEIDLIEEEANQLNAFEFKWNTTKVAKVPKGWSANYPDAGFKIINPNNYLDFIV